MPKDGLVVLNGDDDKLASCDTKGLRTIYYGFHGQEVAATDVLAEGMTATKASITAFGHDFEVTIPLPGIHNVLNGLAATAVAHELGLDFSDIEAGLSAAGTISGRNNVITVHGITIIDDCYNASPSSMKSAIGILGKAPGRTIAVLGDMGELGDNEKNLHASLGEALEDNHIGMLFTVGPLSQEINKSLEVKNSSCMNHHYDKTEDMLTDLLPIIRPGDAILVKASHFMQFDKVVNALVERFK